MKFIKGILLFILTIPSLNTFSQTQTKNLSGEANSVWQFRKSGDAKWLPATVPGTVHTDLLSNKMIDDPYFGDNEKKLQWIDTTTWEYQTSFDCDSAMFSSKHLALQFDGLDTYAKVYLNDVLVLIADNMFRNREVECKGFLKKENNRLVILFEPASREGKKLSKNLSYTLPGDEKVFTRKAAYQYGWDWGPRFVSCGIWRPVKLISWNFFQIKDIHIVQDEISDSVASIVAEVNVKADEVTTVYFKMIIEGKPRDSVYFEQPIRPGENILNLQYNIRNPKRWWTNGLGDPYLYHITIQSSSSFAQSETRKLSFGLRTVQFIQENDSLGRSFYFKLNGIRVFMKGANYIPADNFLPRVTEERYRSIIQSAADANMNMLRVWGGGVYEDEKFYNLCDEKGILVWQDLMFANGMYPGDSLFVENAKQEVIDNVIRLRNHPSIALWCGNNEIEEGWQNWGWQKQYHFSEKDSTKIWKDYMKLFEEEFSHIIQENDPMRSYYRSSPYIGWAHQESFTLSDSHYWGVWWGKEPLSIYKEKVGRFMSEYGFQGMPSLNTFKKVADAKDLDMKSAVVKNHQKHPTGYETIQEYLIRDYKQPKDFENYIYVSQLLQADALKTAIEAHRRGKPGCMGTLYWQLNDCWPVTSWSSVDYFGEWKAAHYAAKKAFEKYLVSPAMEDGKLNVYVISDSRTKTSATLEMRLSDFNGVNQWFKNVPVNLFPDSGKIYFSIDSLDLLKSDDARKRIFSVKLIKDNKVLSDNIVCFNAPKELQLSQPQVSYTFTMNGTQMMVDVESKAFAKNVFIDFGDANVKLSDNYFDLLPGEKKSIRITTSATQDDLSKKIKIKSLIDSY